ncbi:MAG: fimbrillin family protein [Candidatus Cryptobacteroides sp.]
MMDNKNIFGYLLRCWKSSVPVISAAMLIVSCGKAASAGGVEPDGQEPDMGDGRIEIRLSPAMTKVSGDSFEAGDRIGVFML